MICIFVCDIICHLFRIMLFDECIDMKHLKKKKIIYIYAHVYCENITNFRISDRIIKNWS